MKKICIGVDIGGTTVKAGCFTLAGELLKKWQLPTRKEDGGAFILSDTAESIKRTLKEDGISLEEIAGVGMGLPGPVLPNGYVEVCVNLGWHDMNPQNQLSSLLGGIPVKSGNDANVAALGEMWQGGGRGCSDLVMVTLGTGVGGGVIVDQKILTGHHGVGGEIGHIRIREGEQEQCNCKNHGCVEQIASATGIAREAVRRLSQSSQESALRGYKGPITAKDVLNCAKAGDPLALEVMDTVFYYLGWALAIVAMTVDPDIFVIGGGVSKAGRFLIDGIWRYYDKFTPMTKSKAGIALAELGNDAGIYGAARLILS